MSKTKEKKTRSVLKSARKVLESQGRSIARPVEVAGAQSGTFDLAYVRTGEPQEVPAVVIPGGPGLSSVYPYKGFRASAAKEGLDVIMVEHRGVGLSRTMADGQDLPMEAVTVENAARDIAAVLDAEGVDKAIIAGTSYGTYLAQAFATLFPERVEVLVLDSPMLDIEKDMVAAREHKRALLFEGAEGTHHAARAARELYEAGEPNEELAHITQVVYEFAGPDYLAKLLKQRQHGGSKFLWKMLAKMGTQEIDGEGIRGYIEPELVSGIAFGELGFGLPGDGGPLDGQLIFSPVADKKPQYAGEPFDFPAALPTFEFPVVVVSGEQDLRTPPPVARRAAELAPVGRLVSIAKQGHSMLDSHDRILIEVLKSASAGEAAELHTRSEQLSQLPRKGRAAMFGAALKAAINASGVPGKVLAKLPIRRNKS